MSLSVKIKETDTMFDVSVVGNVGIDTNVYLPGQDIDFEHEANFTENCDYVGQAGGYSARGFAQLGYRTAFIGYIGDDFSGRHIRQVFEAQNIDCGALFVDPAGTSRSINFMYADGRRKNFYDGKSHMSLQPDLSVCRKVLQQSRLAHFHIPNWARYLLPIAREAGCIISCDLQDIPGMEDSYRKDFIEQADVMFFSAVHLPTPQILMEDILNRWPQKIVITGMGAQGCVLATSQHVQHFEAQPAPGPVVDTNGAGDGLALGFLSAYFLQNKTLSEAIAFGQQIAAHICTQKASTEHLIPAD